MTGAPVLFLDCDGVLNSTETFDAICAERLTTPYPLSLRRLELLREIIEKTGCDVVLSSSWRKTPCGYEAISKHVPLIGKTDHLGPKRGDEIMRWVAKNRPAARFAVLDDDGDMSDVPRTSFFQTDPDYGLTNTITFRVIRHLNATP